MSTVEHDSVAAPASRPLVRVERAGEFARVTMDVPERRNALSLDHMRQLLAAVRQVAASDARGLLLTAEGPVFCAGHDFRDVVEADLPAMRELLALCTELMTTLQSIPQPVLARVYGLATAAGCQLVATADLAVASEEAGSRSPAAMAAGSAIPHSSRSPAPCRGSARGGDDREREPPSFQPRRRKARWRTRAARYRRASTM